MIETFTPQFFRRLQQLKIRTRRSFLGARQGGHVSLKRGHGLEFADYRPYVQGDDFRQIDWGVYGRTDRLFVRRYREEQDLNVVVLLDASASMAHPEGEGKFELAREIALALGYIALTDGDAVTFSALGQGNSGRFTGARSLHLAVSEVRKFRPAGSFDLATEIRGAISRQKIPGRCFLISDFMVEYRDQIAALDILRARNFETSVVQVLAPSEMSLEFQGNALVEDAESGEMLELSLDSESRREYSQRLARCVGALEKHCYGVGIGHILVSSAESLSDIVLKRFPKIGLLE